MRPANVAAQRRLIPGWWPRPLGRRRRDRRRLCAGRARWPLRVVASLGAGRWPAREAILADLPEVAEATRNPKSAPSSRIRCLPGDDFGPHGHPLAAALVPLYAYHRNFGLMLLLHHDERWLRENIAASDGICAQVAIALHNAETVRAILEHAAKGRSDAVLEEKLRVLESPAASSPQAPSPAPSSGSSAS